MELLNGFGVSVLQDERVTEIGCAMMSMYLTLQNYTVKNSYNGKFYVTCVFPQ